MKPSRILFGSFFVVGGLLLLLAKLDVLHLDLGSIWKFWPVVLVLWGITFLTGARVAKTVIAAIAGILLALILYTIVEGWGSFTDRRTTTSQTFVQTYDSSVKKAFLTFQSGGGTFVLEDTCADLFRGESETNFGKYTLGSETTEGERRLYLRLEGESGKGVHWGKNTVNMRLNPDPEWDLSFDAGAASLTLDLTQFAVSRVKIHAGASKVVLILGERQEDCSVNVDAGISSVKVRVPSSAGTEITSEGALSSRSYHGFESEGKGHYRTENYSSASRRIAVILHAGVSSLSVERY